jgi:ATP-dependent DNA ligase
MAARVSRRAKVGRAIRGKPGALPEFVPPQLTELTETAPEGGDWAHELKWDGYRMHARIGSGEVRLLTRTGLDWTAKYPAIVKALWALRLNEAYLDGELCALSEEGLTSFSAMQTATDARSTEGLVFVLFDLLFLDGEDLTGEPLRVRKERLQALLTDAPPGLQVAASRQPRIWPPLQTPAFVLHSVAPACRATQDRNEGGRANVPVRPPGGEPNER